MVTLSGIKWFIFLVPWTLYAARPIPTFSSLDTHAQQTGIQERLHKLGDENATTFDSINNTPDVFVGQNRPKRDTTSLDNEFITYSQNIDKPKDLERIIDDNKKATVVNHKNGTEITHAHYELPVTRENKGTIIRSDYINTRHINRGDTNYENGQKQIAKAFWKMVLAKAAANHTRNADKEFTNTITTGKYITGKPLNRTKRWGDEYDSNYNWENDGTDYDVPQTSQKKETKLEKWAKNWQKHALRFIFAFAFIMMFVCCCCAACKKFFQKLFACILMHFREWRDVCLNRDPTYRMMRRQADEYGIQLDYEEYKKIRNAYDQALKKHGYSTVDLSGRK